MPRLRRRFPAFTLIELVLVMFIMVLLTVMVVPSFSKLVKTSRVQQASQQVLAMLWQARSEAERCRDPVVVFFGDDPAKLPVQPLPGVLPPKGGIEMWSCQRGWSPGWEDDFLGDEPLPYYVENPGQAVPGWYPFRVKLTNMTPVDGTFPDGVRVLCGMLLNGHIGWIPPYDFDHAFYLWGYRQDPVGEIRRHQIAYGRGGGLAPTSYNVVIVYDEISGDYLLILPDTGGNATHPVIIPDRLKTIGGAPLNDARDLPKMLSQLAPDS